MAYKLIVRTTGVGYRDDGTWFAALRCLRQKKQCRRTGRNKEYREALQASETTMFLTVRAFALLRRENHTELLPQLHSLKTCHRHVFFTVVPSVQATVVA